MTIEDKKFYENDDPEEEQEEAEEKEEEDEEEEDEEDLEDPMDTIKLNCGQSSHCTPYKAELDICEERVNSRERTTEDCTQEMFDFLHCVDHCMAKEMFNHLK